MDEGPRPYFHRPGLSLDKDMETRRPSRSSTGRPLPRVRRGLGKNMTQVPVPELLYETRWVQRATAASRADSVEVDYQGGEIATRAAEKARG